MALVAREDIQDSDRVRGVVIILVDYLQLDETKASSYDYEQLPY